MKYDALRKAGSTFLLVPALNHKIQDNPLKYMDSLVYGLLIYRSRTNKRERIAGIKNRLGIDRSTICSSLKKLLNLGCVKQHPDGYEALEPHGGCRSLFTWKKEPQDSWHSQFSYDKTYLPAETSGLTIIHNAIYWRIVSLSLPVEGGFGHLMIGPGACRQSLSNEYLATGLRCSRKTVAAGLKNLQAQKMIHLHRVGNGRRYQVGIFPIAQHVDKWKKKERKVESLTYEDLFGCASNAPLVPDRRFETKIFELLKKYGIPNYLMEEVRSLVITHCIPDKDLREILAQMRRINARNRERDPRFPDHCGKLLVSELMRRAAAGEWRIYEGITSTVPTLSEMEVRDYLNSLRVCSNAYILLRELSDEPSVELRSGERLAIAFCWDAIWEIAKNAGRDFEHFQRSVSDYLFPSSKKPKSDWLDYWSECEVVARLLDWPNEEIPLPAKGRGFVETVRRWARAGSDEVTAAKLTNLFIQWIERQQDSKWHEKPTSNMSQVLRLFERWKRENLGDSAEGLIDQFFYE